MAATIRSSQRTVKSDKTLEKRLWDAADALHGNQEPSEYKHVVLGLVFLKYIFDRFAERRQAIAATLSNSDYIPNQARRQAFLEDRDEYTSHNVFWVPADARLKTIQAGANLPSIGQDIDRAMDLIEKENRLVPQGIRLRPMRSKVRRLLAKYDYPPDHEEKVIELVLQRAELLAGAEAA